MQIRLSTPSENVPMLDVPRHDARANDPDPWAQTLRLLEILRVRAGQEADLATPRKRCKEAKEEVRAGASRARKQPQREARRCADMGASVTLVERLSDTAVVLRWCSRYGHYGDQVWVCRAARCAGVCAVTGNLIRRGEAVYRPQSRRLVTLVNADAMIHPSALA
jgi:hypothetical protein